MFIAHRGNGLHKYKENTKEAILSVLDENVEGVEFDVRITKDKKIVINHDPIYNGNIINLTNLKDLGNISLLDDTLKKIKSDKIILIEVKCSDLNYEQIYTEVLKIIKKYKLNIYISSFNKKLVEKFKDKQKVGIIIGYYINTKFLYNEYDFNIVNFNYKDKINKQKQTFIWTINNAKKAKKIDDNALIITDKYYLIK